MEVVDLAEQRGDERNGGADLGDGEKARAQAVVDVMRIVGDVVSDRGRLSLEAGMAREIEGLTFIVAEDGGRNAPRPVSLGGRAGGVEERAIVLDQPRQ